MNTDSTTAVSDVTASDVNTVTTVDVTPVVAVTVEPATNAAATRKAGMNAIMASLPGRMRATPMKGKGVSAPNLNLTKSKNDPGTPVQVKVIQKGDRGFSNTNKYLEMGVVDGVTVATGLKAVNRELPVVVVVLDEKAGTNEVFVSNVGTIQDLMFQDYTKRQAKTPGKAVAFTFYKPADLGATAGDWSSITNATAPAPVVVMADPQVVVVPMVEAVAEVAVVEVEVEAETSEDEALAELSI
jgi:hypothetical protein